MKHSGSHGGRVVTGILSLLFMTFWSWNPLGGWIPIQYQQEQATAIRDPSQVSETMTPAGTERADLPALETPASAPAKGIINWVLPCLGAFFILLGIFLFGMAKSNSGKHGKHKHFK